MLMYFQVLTWSVPQGYQTLELISNPKVGNDYAKVVLPNRQGFDNLVTGFLSINSDQKTSFQLRFMWKNGQGLYLKGSPGN